MTESQPNPLAEAERVYTRVKEGIVSSWPKECCIRLPKPVGFVRNQSGDTQVTCEYAVSNKRNLFISEKKREVTTSLITILVGMYDAFDHNPDSVREILLGISGDDMHKSRITLPGDVIRGQYGKVTEFIRQVLELDITDPMEVFPSSFYTYLEDSLRQEIETEIENQADRRYRQDHESIQIGPFNFPKVVWNTGDRIGLAQKIRTRQEYMVPHFQDDPKKFIDFYCYHIASSPEMFKKLLEDLIFAQLGISLDGSRRQGEPITFSSRINDNAEHNKIHTQISLSPPEGGLFNATVRREFQGVSELNMIRVDVQDRLVIRSKSNRQEIAFEGEMTGVALGNIVSLLRGGSITMEYDSSLMVSRDGKAYLYDETGAPIQIGKMEVTVGRDSTISIHRSKGSVTIIDTEKGTKITIGQHNGPVHVRNSYGEVVLTEVDAGENEIHLINVINIVCKKVRAGLLDMIDVKQIIGDEIDARIVNAIKCCGSLRFTRSPKSKQITDCGKMDFVVEKESHSDGETRE